MNRLLLALLGIGLLAPSANAQAITLDRYEYWFNQDYTSHVSNAVTGANVDIPVLNISTFNLPNGPHVLRFRFRDSQGQWSSVVSRNFIKMWDSSTLTHYEYWFDEEDDDASRISVSVSGTDVNIPDLSINTDSLDLGPHNLRFRFQDSQGQWGSVVSRAFIKMLDAPYLITAVRYWLTEEMNPSGMQYHYFDTPATSIDIVDELLDACMFPTGAGQMLKIQVRDNHGQWSSVITRPLNVNPPGTLAIEGIDPLEPICPGAEVTFTATPQAGAAIPTSYDWSVPSGDGWSHTPSSGASITVIIGTVPGSISAIGNNACGSSASFSLLVTLPTAPAQPAMSGTWDVLPCEETNVTYAVQAVDGVQYEWSGAATGNGNSVTFAIGSDDATITVTPYNACGDPGTPLTASITVQQAPEAPVISESGHLCAGGEVTLSVAQEPGITYTWATTETGTSIVVNTAGPYDVEADNGFGCGMTSATIDVVLDDLHLDTIVGQTVITVGGTYDFTATPSLPAATGYGWIIPASMTWNDLDTNGVVAHLQVISSGTDSIGVVPYSADCVGATLWITVTVDLSVGIASRGSNGMDIDVHPNPSSGLFSVVMSTDMGPFHYVVLNALGQVVLPSATLRDQATIDLSSLASGSYLLRWQGSHSSGQRTLLVQH